jgi:hypothetical protein
VGLAVTGSSTAALLIPALIGVAALVTAVVLFGLLMRMKQLARRIGQALSTAWSWLRRLVRKPPVTGWDEAAVRFRRQSNDLVARRQSALTLHHRGQPRSSEVPGSGGPGLLESPIASLHPGPAAPRPGAKDWMSIG